MTRSRKNALLASALALVVVASTAAAVAHPMPAQVTVRDVDAHKARMLAAEELKLDLIDALDAGSAPQAVSVAARLRPLLEAEHIFWDQTGDRQAIGLSQRNLEALSGLSSAAAKGSAGEIQTAAINLVDSCTACHEAHPERRYRVGH